MISYSVGPICVFLFLFCFVFLLFFPFNFIYCLDLFLFYLIVFVCFNYRISGDKFVTFIFLFDTKQNLFLWLPMCFCEPLESSSAQKGSVWHLVFFLILTKGVGSRSGNYTDSLYSAFFSFFNMFNGRNWYILSSASRLDYCYLLEDLHGQYWITQVATHLPDYRDRGMGCNLVKQHYMFHFLFFNKICEMHLLVSSKVSESKGVKITI